MAPPYAVVEPIVDMSHGDARLGAASERHNAERTRRIALERELEELQVESERSKRTLDSLAAKIQSLQAEVEIQQRQKPTHCHACRTVSLQVDAAAQSLLGCAGHVVRTLLRDTRTDRSELLGTVLCYLDPVKHLDPDLEELYVRAQASVDTTCSRFPPPVSTPAEPTASLHGGSWNAAHGTSLRGFSR